MANKSIGNTIRQLRDRKAWTQEQLAEAAGVSVRTVQRAEEESTMSAQTLASLATALDIPPEEITDGQGSATPVITPVIYYDDPDTLDWLVSAFGFAVSMRIPGPDGKILHAELTLNGDRIMVGQPVPARNWTTPLLAGVHTQSLYVMVDDVDSHCEQAAAAGAVILSGPEDMHGERRYLTVDPEGHHWWFACPL